MRPAPKGGCGGGYYIRNRRYCCLSEARPEGRVRHDTHTKDDVLALCLSEARPEGRVRRGRQAVIARHDPSQ